MLVCCAYVQNSIYESFRRGAADKIAPRTMQPQYSAIRDMVNREYRRRERERESENFREIPEIYVCFRIFRNGSSVNETVRFGQFGELLLSLKPNDY